jgi:amino acid adenylation domain-containing protein
MVSHAADGVRRPYKTVCDKVEHWAEVQPDHTAISFGDRKISYAELDNAASHIAWLLSRRNVGKGDKIPVLAQRSPEMVACFLGVLKSGALYVPIDTESWSQDRIQWVLNRVSARVILNTTTDQFPGYQEISHCAIEAAFSPAEDLVARGRADQQLDRPWHRIEPSNLAYIIFTSGTTSTPKGVMVQHSSVLNYVEQGGHETPFNLNATPSDRVMLIFSPGFDGRAAIFLPLFVLWLTKSCVHVACTGVIVSTLCNGAQLQIATTSDFLHTVTLCTIMVCTPSVLNTIQDPTTCSRLHTVVLGGEAPPSSLVRRWAAALPTCAMYNFYGPTETTFASLVSRLFPEAPITLGRPMSNSRVLLLDGDEEAAYGEICITGPGLARGYFENEALTSEKFVDWRGERIYRTGDFARQTEHGLEFSGRKDSFVKNRGFLVNLESQVIPILHGCPDVMAATAFMHSGRLVAFVTPAEVDTLALRESLSSHHDAFVVPDLIRALDFLPLTPNGKADNRALQQLLDSEMSAKAGGAASSSDLISEDASVMDILKAALSTSLSLPVSDINERYSFRELGGNSLAGLKVLSFLRTRGLRLRLIHLFDLPNLSSICEVIEQEPASLGRDNTATLTTGPMTSVQAKMIQAGLRDAAVNYMLLRITFPHPGTTISPQRLQDSWHQVMQRHAIFRTTFVLKDGLQHVRPEMDAAWNCEEASQEQLEKLVKLRSQELRQRISLLPEQSEEFVPVQACNLVVVPGKASTLLVLAHHSQADGWSFSVILNELRSALDGRDLADPPQYMDVALAQKKLQDDAQGKVFWSELLENRLDQPPLALLPSSPDNEDTGWSTSQELGLGITPGYLESKARVLRRVTPATLFYCAWGLVLSNYTFTDNVSFGVVFSGRNIGTSGVDNVVGPLVNTCPFPLELGCYETINGLVSHAQTRLLHMMEHQWSADEAMAKIPAGRIANTFQSIVVMEYDLPTPDGPCEVLPEPWEVERKDRMEFGISLLLERGGDGALRARILFDGSRFAESSIRGLLSHFRSALHEFLQPQNTSIQTVRENMITGKERARLLNSANHPVEYAAHSATLKDAFESMATQYPDLRAVESVSGCMTYRELDVAANSLATHIRWSASPNDVVGVLTDGSLYWIVSILAVLKAGCVCCPIDINLPTTRIDTIRRQSGAVVFVAANRHCASVIDNSRARVIICDEFLNTSRESILPLSTVSEPRDVVYLVFTSGSTGTPKGPSASLSPSVQGTVQTADIVNSFQVLLCIIRASSWPLTPRPSVCPPNQAAEMAKSTPWVSVSSSSSPSYFCELF